MSAEVFLDVALVVLLGAAVAVWGTIVRALIREHRVHDRDGDLLP